MNTRTILPALLAAALTASTTQAGLDTTDILLFPSDGSSGTNYGYSVSLDGNIGLVGAPDKSPAGLYSQGGAYLFRNLDTVISSVQENARPEASDADQSDHFGFSVSVSGTNGLVAAYTKTVNSNSARGAVYYFRNLNTARETFAQSIRLLASDGAARSLFGTSVSLSGKAAVVGAPFHDGTRGKVYVYGFSSFDLPSGDTTETATLSAPDATPGDYFGTSVSLSGTIAVIGAPSKTVGESPGMGAAYAFHNVPASQGNNTESVKLLPSDGAAGDSFGSSVSLSGTTAVIGSPQHKVASVSTGAAYLFRSLDNASGTTNEVAIMTASNAAEGDGFGYSTSLSDTIALVGAPTRTVGTNSAQGAVYLFRNLDTRTDTISEAAMFTASNGVAEEGFGVSVSLSGEKFLIGTGSKSNNNGRVFTGNINTFTSVDEGNTTRHTGGISFLGRGKVWYVGNLTNGNTVTIDAGDTVDISESGSVYIGRGRDVSDNTLIVEGTLRARAVYIGSPSGNSGNTLRLESTPPIGAKLRLSAGNTIAIRGTDFASIETVLNFLDTSTVEVLVGETWTTVTPANASALIVMTAEDGYTLIKLADSVEPTPTPTATPTPTPQPPAVDAKPILQIGGSGEKDARYITRSSRQVVRGISKNVDIVCWKFAGDRSYRKVKINGSNWKIPMGPLEKGLNFIRVYGVNASTGSQTPVHNGVIIRK